MPFLPTVIHAEPRDGFKIRLTFNDGLESTVGFLPWLDGPVFEPLKDRAYFQRFFVEGGTVTWPTGRTWRTRLSTSARRPTRLRSWVGSPAGGSSPGSEGYVPRFSSTGLLAERTARVTGSITTKAWCRVRPTSAGFVPAGSLIEA
jgi:hypothetical protein